MNRKAALELPTSFLVGLIIGIVLFVMGLILAYKIFSIEPPGNLPEEFDYLVENCIQKGEPVCIPEIRKEIAIRDSDVFGVVINNNLGEQEEFKLYIAPSRAILRNGSVVGFNAEGWTLDQFRPVNLMNNEYEIVKIPFQVPGGTEKGSYNFNVYVCFNSEENLNPDLCTEDYPSLYSPGMHITIVVK